ncbi:MFS transporter [Microlunatus speluncae]|uniref:MFS transporter n=1 Tax=Microlunatus speluncae TaxID=2594267 RepID=UPI0012665819|nr:MFS transporter [Microlunatus speluncae]
MSSTSAESNRLTPGARKAVVAGTIGTLIEWYDYALYGAAASLVINHLFFPDLVPSAGVLAAFATFAVGFFVRPLGGVIISQIGDRVGRKPAMILSVALMGGATVLMGLLPGAASIGVLAPLLLILLRLIQGFGAGAELAGAITLIAEYAPRRRRGLYTAIPNAATAGGSALATLAFLAVSGLPDDVLLSWGWRVPFLISAVLFVIALYIRNRLDETPEYVAAMKSATERRQREQLPLRELFRDSWRLVLLGFLSITGHNAWAYLLNTFALSYLTTTIGLARTEALIPVLIAAFTGMLLCPFLGLAADRFGYRQVFILGASFAIVWVVPLFLGLSSGNVIIATIVMALAFGLGFGAMAGAQGAMLVNLFPVRYRFSGVAVARELNGVLIAGPTPFIASGLVLLGNQTPWLVCGYLVLCCAATIGAVLAIGRAGDVSADEPVGS